MLLVLGCLVMALILAPSGQAFVYWANKYGDSIGRADDDGLNPDPSFITLPAETNPVGLAIDGAYIYWASYDDLDSIGRAKLDGTGSPDNGFITGAHDPVGV